MPSHASLDAAAQDRKARLAKLKSLKRKAPDSTDEPGSLDDTTSETPADPSTTPLPASNPYISGRNYDPETRGPKLGFEHNPSADADTAERRAQGLTAQAKAEAEKEEAADEAAKQLDLFKLQPKKANWDLKRDVEKRMERLNVQTENAIAKAVRERIAGQRKKQDAANGSAGEGVGADVAADGEVLGAGFKGEELVSALHAKEAQEEEEERREREEDKEEEEGFK